MLSLRKTLRGPLVLHGSARCGAACVASPQKPYPLPVWHLFPAIPRHSLLSSPVSRYPSLSSPVHRSPPLPPTLSNRDWRPWSVILFFAHDVSPTALFVFLVFFSFSFSLLFCFFFFCSSPVFFLAGPRDWRPTCMTGAWLFLDFQVSLSLLFFFIVFFRFFFSFHFSFLCHFFVFSLVMLFFLFCFLFSVFFFLCFFCVSFTWRRGPKNENFQSRPRNPETLKVPGAMGQGTRCKVQEARWKVQGAGWKVEGGRCKLQTAKCEVYVNVVRSKNMTMHMNIS